MRTGYCNKRILIVVFSLMAILPGNLSFKIKENPGHEKERIAWKKAVRFLQDVQLHDGAIRDSINPLFETWETILAAKAIFQFDPDTNSVALKNAMRFLFANENDGGLICHNQKCKRGYCLETTSVYFDLLQQTGKNKKDVMQTIAALQKATGEWEIGNPDVREQKDFPSVTAFVVNMLRDAGISTANKDRALTWILSKQTRQGNWGLAWEYYGCPAYALWPIMKMLKGESSDAAKQAKEKAVAFILSTQLPDGSWLYHDPSVLRQTSAELQTALMLAALQGSGVNDQYAIEKGVAFLLDKQEPKGNWNGGYFPLPGKRYFKQEYIFATAMAADVLYHHLQKKGDK